MANFTWSQLSTYLERRGQDLETGVGRALFELGSDYVNRTPVREGFARGSLTAGINTTRVPFRNTEDTSGSTSINQILDTSKQFKIGDTFFVLSNLVYFPKLEYGSSAQAPMGIFRIANDNFGRHLQAGLRNG